MLKAFYYFLNCRGDFILLVLLVGAACLAIQKIIRKRGPQYRIPRKSFIVAGVLVLSGGLAAEWAGRDRIVRLQKLFAGFGPTYAAELAAMGHAEISLTTDANDPRYLAIIEAEKRWLSVNPIIADIYTFRKDNEGKLRLIVDSETDYDHDGKFDGEREKRTPIGEVYDEATPKFFAALEGKSIFEGKVVSDRWGIWVSSFTPILDKDGKVEAGVGIDYPAENWLFAIGGVRAAALLLTIVVVIILLTSSTLIGFLNAEIEDRKKTELRLQEANETAFSTSAAKSEFLALMSHEVRNPLTAILGFANILADTQLDGAQRRYIETINRAGASLMQLLNDILDYTRVESGKLKLEHIEWTPALLVHEVMELMSVSATQKGIQLNFDNQLPPLLTLLGDPTRVRQILINFVGNAVKFTGKGSVTVKAQWTPNAAKAEHGSLSLEVIDTGVGIPADKIPLLFQAFSQTDTSTTRHHGGTGLGLAICKRLADMMGAKLGLQSTPNVGTTLSFTLESESVKATPPKPAPGAQPVPAAAVIYRALVIDDVRLNRELLKVMLRRFGFEADLATGGPEAVKLAAENQYAIIFTDLEMPDMDGFQTARQIRAGEPRGRRTPIVAVSGLTALGTREKCIAAGMDDYLTKPVYGPALESAIAAFHPNRKRPGSLAQPRPAAA